MAAKIAQRIMSLEKSMHQDTPQVFNKNVMQIPYRPIFLKEFITLHISFYSSLNSAWQK